MTILEGLAYVVVIFVLDRVGRKLIFSVCMTVAGIACLATMIPELLDDPNSGVNSALSNIGKFGATICFGTLYIYTAELLPTSVRSSGLGICSFSGRIGALISQPIADIKIVVDGKIGKILPLVIFGAIAIFSGVMSLFLPETNGLPLPATIEEAEAM